MKAHFKRLIVGVLAVVLLLSCVACGTTTDDTKSIDDSSAQQSDTTTKPDETTNQGGDKTESLLSGTFKVARKDIYVDVPNYNSIEEGYTQIYLDGSSKYVTFTCLKVEEASNVQDAHDKAFECFKSGIDSHHHINEEQNLQTEETSVNSIQVLKFEGTVSVGRNPVYDAYTYGYSFVYDGLPCAIIGVVMDETQPEDDQALVKEIVDEMMKTVRNSK